MNYLNDGICGANWDIADNHWVRHYFKFSVVRNPWDRFVSGWLYCESTKHRPIKDVLRNLPKEGHDYRHITRRQCDLLIDANDQVAVDYIIFFEDLQRGFDMVCDRIGKPRVQLGHYNVGSRKHYKEYFDEEAKSFFYDHYCKDIEFLGYSF
jgi:hypothetical protein